MIVPDVNLLIYAYTERAPEHETARRWLESLFNGTEEVGLPWLVTVGFIREYGQSQGVRQSNFSGCRL